MRIRKIITLIDEARHEAGVTGEPPLRKVAAAAVISNPFAGAYQADLSSLVEASAGLGKELSGLALQAIAACVIGGVQLMGGRGSVVGAVAGALSLFALFTLLNLVGLPQSLRDTAQGLILISAVASGAWRLRHAG